MTKSTNDDGTNTGFSYNLPDSKFPISPFLGYNAAGFVVFSLPVYDRAYAQVYSFIPKGLNPECSLELRHEGLNGNTSVRFLGFSVAPLR